MGPEWWRHALRQKAKAAQELQGNAKDTGKQNYTYK